VKQCSEHLLDNVALFKHQQCRTHPHICFRNQTLTDLTSSLHSPVEPLPPRAAPLVLKARYASPPRRDHASCFRGGLEHHSLQILRAQRVTTNVLGNTIPGLSAIQMLSTITTSQFRRICLRMFTFLDINNATSFIPHSCRRAPQKWHSRRPCNWPSFFPLSCCRF
jgi:hypothetical protein